MAKEGYTGPVEVVEGKEGLIEVLNNVEWRPDEMTKGLGSDFLITQCSYKAFPTEALTHPIMVLLQKMSPRYLSRQRHAEQTFYLIQVNSSLRQKRPQITVSLTSLLQQ
jgi:2-methylcitrate dehydratase PrpD